MQTGAEEESAQAQKSQGMILLGAALFLLVVGLALLVFGFTFVSDANASREWPTAPGTVQNLGVTWSTSSSDPGERVREYFYEVYYDYEVDGQAYSGSRYSVGNGSTASSQTWDTEEEARAAANEAYTLAQNITVYYDPEEPASAVLNPGANSGTYVPLIFGAVLLLSGLGLGWLYLRQRALLPSET